MEDIRGEILRTFQMENLWPDQKSPRDDKFSHNEVSSLVLYVMRVWFPDFTTIHYDLALFYSTDSGG